MLQKKSFTITLLLLIISTFFFNSCGTTKLPPCISAKSKNVVIKWGEINTQSGITTWYELNTSKEISLTLQREMKKDKSSQNIGSISEETYCKIMKKSTDELMKSQALNNPGVVSNFFEYVDETQSMRFRAVWNPEYDNAGNKEFKILFKLLQDAVAEASK